MTTSIIVTWLATLMLVFAGACGDGKGPAAPVVPLGTSSSPDAAAKVGLDAGEPRDSAVTTSADVRQVNAPGEVVLLENVLVPGKVTVIDFWAEWCGACKIMAEKLLRDIAGVQGIAVRKIDIMSDTSPVAKHFGVGKTLPELWIFDARGVHVHRLVGNRALQTGRLAIELVDANGAK